MATSALEWSLKGEFWASPHGRRGPGSTRWRYPSLPVLTAATRRLPLRANTGGNLYYGSGFADGSSPVPAHSQEHTTFNLSVGKAVAENLTVSVTALNLANRRFLLDNSQTFGGTHSAEPRQIYVQLRYRFHM